VARPSTLTLQPRYFDLLWICCTTCSCMQSCSRWQDFDWHSASRGPFAAGDLLVFFSSVIIGAASVNTGIVLSLLATTSLEEMSKVRSETGRGVQFFQVIVGRFISLYCSLGWDESYTSHANVYYCKKTLQFKASHNCGWITQLKQQISKRRYYLAAHCPVEELSDT